MHMGLSLEVVTVYDPYSILPDEVENHKFWVGFGQQRGSSFKCSFLCPTMESLGSDILCYNNLLL